MTTPRVTTNFGAINGRCTVSFRVSSDGRVPPAWASRDDCDPKWYITGHEAFVRWKIARKAWRTRKYKNQMELEI